MKSIKNSAAAAAIAALALMLGACASSNTSTDLPNTDYGQVRPEDQSEESKAVAVIPGPAKVDSDGNLYTSSAVGSTGNAGAIGLNTNVTVIPDKPKSTVTITESPAVVELAPPPPPPVVVVPPPPPVIVAEVPPPPPPVVVDIDDEPMISSTQEETRPRMSKD